MKNVVRYNTAINLVYKHGAFIIVLMYKAEDKCFVGLWSIMGNKTPGGRVPQASQSGGGMLRVAKHPEAWRVTSQVAKLHIKRLL